EIAVALRGPRDRVVRGDARQVGHTGRHVASPHTGAVPKLGNVRWRGGETPHQLRLEPRVASDGLGELYHPGRVPEHLDGLDPRDLVEEPAARRVHEQAVTLELE